MLPAACSARTHAASRTPPRVCAGRVGSVGRTVESKYGDGLFTQYPAEGTQLYQVRPATLPGERVAMATGAAPPQLTAPLQKIEEVEHQLLSVVAKLKSRLRWLQSGR